MALRVTIPGKPTPKSRPKVRKNGHVFTPSSASEEHAAHYFRAAGRRFAGEVAVAMHFYGANPSADIDNLAKLYLDAMVKAGTIKDDRFVRGLYVERKPLDNERRTVVCIGDWT